MARPYGQVEPAGKIRSSITNKLQIKLFWRLVGIFLCVNIMIVLIAAGSLAFYSENRVVRAFELLSDNDIPTENPWNEFLNMNVTNVTQLPRQGTLTWPFNRYLPIVPLDSARGFRARSEGFEGTLRSITYVVAIETEENSYEVELLIGDVIFIFVAAMFGLIFIELIILLSALVNDRKMIRKSLDPISEFARAAQSFSELNKQLEHEKIMALAGRLDGIDAGHLDARIPIEDLHEELRNVGDAINGMLDRINRSYAAQARFVSDASHELRTPIAVIQGYANLLDRWGKEDEKTLTESITAIKDEAESMKELVEQLLFLARGDSNRISLVKERVYLPDIIDEVINEMRMLGTKQVLSKSGVDAVVLADRALVKQALRILVDNAIKYTDDDGHIIISSSVEDNLARLSVEDNGIGISPEILPNVFDRFVRADESRARATGGAGLGLSIAQWIAARHSGHMEVLSREGIGTKISFVLPALIDTVGTVVDATQVEPVVVDNV